MHTLGQKPTLMVQKFIMSVAKLSDISTTNKIETLINSTCQHLSLFATDCTH